MCSFWSLLIVWMLWMLSYSSCCHMVQVCCCVVCVCVCVYHCLCVSSQLVSLNAGIGLRRYTTTVERRFGRAAQCPHVLKLSFFSCQTFGRAVHHVWSGRPQWPGSSHSCSWNCHHQLMMTMLSWRHWMFCCCRCVVQSCSAAAAAAAALSHPVNKLYAQWCIHMDTNVHLIFSRQICHFIFCNCTYKWVK